MSVKLGVLDTKDELKIFEKECPSLLAANASIAFEFLG
jgi:hypothetical protein